MAGTKTSSFGTSKRESHDSSSFYSRSMASSDVAPAFTSEELASIAVPVIGPWADRVYCSSSEHMDEIPSNSIALAFTSPPYNVGKDYEGDLPRSQYLGLIQSVAAEVYRTLRPGGRYVVNVANLGRKPYIPVHSLFWSLHIDVGFLPMGEIIWQKGRGANGNCAWGSWMSAKAPRLRDVHEYLLVMAKGGYSRPDAGASDIEREEFLASTISIWQIPPESAQKVGHPAPFPVCLAERVIRLFTYVGDVVLDPFVGSGTTCVAAINTARHYSAYEIDRRYCAIAEGRIAEALSKRRQLALGLPLD